MAKRKNVRNRKSLHRTNELLKVPITFELLERTLKCLVFIRPLDPDIILTVDRLFSRVDKEIFSTFEDRKVRYEMIQAALIAIREKKFLEPSIIADFIIGSSNDNSEVFSAIIDEIREEYDNSSDAEILETTSFVKGRVNNLLQYSSLFNSKERISEIIQELNAGNVARIEELAKNFSEVTKSVNSELSKASAASSISRGYIFGTDAYKTSLDDSLADAKRTSATINVGIRELNKLLGGGFRSEKVYVFIAAPGTGKSVFLLNMAKLAVFCNPKLKSRNPGLKPIVLFISQENSINETNERFFSVAAPEIETEWRDLDPISTDEIYREKGWYDKNIGFALEYRDNREIDTADIDNMIDSYAERGYEVVTVIHDYVKRVRAAIPGEDERHELGNIINEECVIAKKRKIPFITVMQVNREAMSKIEDAKNTGKSPEKILNATSMGESMLIYENCDYCGALYPYDDPVSNKRYLCVIKLKSRYRINCDYPFVAIPYVGNSICLESNYGQTQSNVLLSIGDGLKSHVPSSSMGKRLPSSRGVKTEAEIIL